MLEQNAGMMRTRPGGSMDAGLSTTQEIASPAKTASNPFQSAVKISTAMATPEGKNDLKTLFEMCDKTGDGKVNIMEWGKAVVQDDAAVAKYLGGGADMDFVAAFKSMDKDKSNSVTWEEFEASAGAYSTASKISLAMATP